MSSLPPSATARMLGALHTPFASLEHFARALQRELEAQACAGAGGAARRPPAAGACVQQAWLRLVRDHDVDWPARCVFYDTASDAVRRLLLEQAQAARTAAHVGLTLSIPEFGVEDDPARGLLLVHALDRLGAADAVAAQVARLRVFAGLSVQDVAHALELPARDAGREWTYARTRLQEALEGLSTDLGHAPAGHGS